MNIEVRLQEHTRARAFFERICQHSPVCFTLDGVSSAEWLQQAERQQTCTETDKQIRATVRHIKDGLQLRVEAVLWKQHPAVEWTGWLENAGNQNTAQISRLYAFDAVLAPEMISNHPGINHTYTLSHFKGDYYSPDGFEQKRHFLSNGIPAVFHNEGGRSSSTELPYYRLCSRERAIAVAVSWQGQWETAFEFDWQNGVKFRAGQQHFNAYLKPGEKVRTPLVALLFSEDADEDRCINLWRDWMICENTPRAKDGSQLPPMCSCGSNAYFFEAKHATEQNQLEFINAYAEQKFPFDVWWIDAMWYNCGSERLPNWCPVGTWEADPVRFPQTLKPISERLHQINASLLAWFEPERVSPGTELYEQYPSFTLTTPTAEREDIQKGAMGTDTNASIDNSRLLNLADDAVTDWLIEKINHTIDVNGIDIYRQDMNTNPLRVWLHNDEPNRLGILENKYCVNLLRYWDALAQAHPGMLMDTCASGGRRIELETVRRAVALCKSDYNAAGGPLITGAFHHSLYQWLPYFGSLGVSWNPMTDYTFAANFAGWIGVSLDVREQPDYQPLRRFVQLHKSLAHVLRGNYYPLLPYTRDAREWIAWQFHLPQTEEGVFLALAHTQSVFENAVFSLREIDPQATYAVQRVKNLQLESPRHISGAELARCKTQMQAFPDAVVLYYKKV